MLGEIGVRVTLAARPMREHLPKIKNRETDFYMLGWGTSYFDSKDHFSYLICSDTSTTRPATPICASTT